MKKPTESHLIRSCLDLLGMCGIMAWRNNQGAIPLPEGGYRRFTGRRGASDIIGILPAARGGGGRFLAIETKMPGKGRLSKDQRVFLDEIKANGGLALVVKDLRELADVLREHGYLP